MKNVKQCQKLNIEKTEIVLRKIYNKTLKIVLKYRKIGKTLKGGNFWKTEKN